MLVTPDAGLFPGFSGLTPAFVRCDGDAREPDLGQLPRKPASRAPTMPTGSMPAPGGTDEHSMKVALHEGAANALNLYSTTAGRNGGVHKGSIRLH
jgi:hypothetical protein